VTEKDVAHEIEAELAKLSVADVLLHTASTVATLAYRGLTPEHRDLDQVRLAIDSLQTLLPLLDDQLPSEIQRDFRAAVANLQLSYADAVGHLQ
jgi:hypothetical protein